MRILIVTALYPPEINATATYCKELAKRLTAKSNKVTVLTYTTLPEELSKVQIIKVNKQFPLPVRLIVFSLKLFLASRKVDIIHVENGSSVGLPVAVMSIFLGAPFIIHIGDERANKVINKKLLLRWIRYFASLRSSGVIDNMPLEKPEILPFDKPNNTDLDKYNNSWDIHLKILDRLSKKCINV